MITGLVLKRRQVIKEMEQGYWDTSSAPGTNRNNISKMKRYYEFCDFGKIRPFPVTEFKIYKFATYMADLVKTVQSIKSYCGTVCD